MYTTKRQTGFELGNLTRSIPEIVASLILPFIACVGSISHAQTITEGCKNSTVDAFGPEQASRARAFLSDLQAFVKAGNKQSIASVIAYPLRIFVGNEKRTIANRSEFVAKYADIITPHVQEMILKESATCLFGNVGGAMIGGGEVWFQVQPDGNFKIISVKTNAALKLSSKSRPVVCFANPAEQRALLSFIN